MLCEVPADITLLVKNEKCIHQSLFIPPYSVSSFESNDEELVREFRLVVGVSRCKLKKGNTKARRLLISGSKNAVDVVILRASHRISKDRLLDHLRGCIQAVCIELLLTVDTVV